MEEEENRRLFGAAADAENVIQRWLSTEPSPYAVAATPGDWTRWQATGRAPLPPNRGPASSRSRRATFSAVAGTSPNGGVSRLRKRWS